MDLNTLRSNVLTELQDEGGIYFSPVVVKNLLNEGQRVFCRQTRILRASKTLNVVAGTAEYDLSTLVPEVMEVLAVACPQSAAITSPIALRYMTWEELEAQDTLWRTRTGNPRAYMRYQEGPLKVRLYPIPDMSYNALIGAPPVAFDGAYGIIGSATNLTDAQWTSAYGMVSSTGVIYGALTVDYVAAPIDMAAITDEPTVPPEFHEALYWYAVARCCEMDVSISQANKAQGYWAKFAEHVQRAQRYAAGGYQNKPPRSVSVREF